METGIYLHKNKEKYLKKNTFRKIRMNVKVGNRNMETEKYVSEIRKDQTEKRNVRERRQ